MREPGAARVLTGGWSGVRAWVARPERVLWVTLILVVLLMQWPMLKGRYYRAAGTPLPATSTAWQTDLNVALEEARRTQKSVLVDFTAGWCPPCIAMQHDVWPETAVERALAERYSGGGDRHRSRPDDPSAVRRQWDSDGLVLDDEGRVLRRAGFLSASGMVRFLTETD